MKKFTNALINEDSPYLLQHAHNPLDWMAWSEAAFEKAQKEEKLVFLSIGYSTCHWCHVMERESFENEEIANRVNQNYVSIKVDREEMPHIDKMYQDVHYLLQRRAGGWPLSIIMTPQREVIFAATYLPPKSRNNMMGFRELTDFIAEKYHNDFDEVQKSADSIKRAYAKYVEQKKDIQELDKNIVDTFIDNTKQSFDEEYKGIGNAPKFPHTSTFDTLIDIHKLTKSYEPLHMALESYEAMAKGGIYDQIEGGFYRYSVDEAWRIPHFEKMLYTNAELIVGYAKLYACEKNELFKETVIQSIEAMQERFLKEGLYLSASDADSDGVEGRYFTFTYEEAKKALEADGIDAHKVLEYFGITKFGNFEHGLSNPHVNSHDKPKNLLHVKEILKKLRSHVSYPFIDYKVLTSWNALMINALFEAGKYIDEKYTSEALSSLETLLKSLHVKGVLYHQVVTNSPLKIKALLEDYAFLIEALLKAYQSCLDEKYLSLADDLTHEGIKKFYKNEQWYLSDDGFESLAPLEDASYKSAMATMIQNIYRVSLLKEDAKLLTLAQTMSENISGSLVSYPHAYSEGLKCALMYLYPSIVIKTSKQNALHVKSILQQINYPYAYIKVVAIEGFQACTQNNCFYTGEDIEELKKSLKAYM
jgi:uncharacterized protein YyaL (SSP411 family)